MMEIQRIAIKSLALNEGQVEGLPRNPRTWTRDELDRLARSIEETPELFEARPVLAYDWKDGEPFIVLGGNMRLTAAKQLGWKDVPCIVYPRGTERDKLAEIVIKDNGAFGAWDWDMLANEWDALPLSEWGVPTWKVESGLTGELPSELDGVDIDPDELPKLEGDDNVAMERIMIVFAKEDSEGLRELLGMESLKKVVYKFTKDGLS